ncbi:unnamed protein product [Lymnaea stagnalis]|uniref:Uncharacterized protein n=1 Tax=Lymnaea stagnalis TaxID=6523 RepID=A0AAV2HN14_LYMST
MAVQASILTILTIITSLALHFIKAQDVRPTAELGTPIDEDGPRTGEPFVTTIKPFVTTKKPLVTTKKPFVTTGKTFVTTQKPVEATAVPGFSTAGAILPETEAGIFYTTKTYWPAAEFNLLKDDAGVLTAGVLTAGVLTAGVLTAGVLTAELGVPPGDEMDETPAKPELVIRNVTNKASSGLTTEADSARTVTVSSSGGVTAGTTDRRVQTDSGVSAIKTAPLISAPIGALSSKPAIMKSTTVQPNTVGPEFILSNGRVDPLGDVTISTTTSTTPATAMTSTATNTRTTKLPATNPYQWVRPLHPARAATPTPQHHTAASLYSWMLFGRDMFPWLHLLDNQHQ